MPQAADIAGPESTGHGYAASGYATAGQYARTARSAPTRYASRASYDRAAVHAVIDEALVCHVGFIRDGAPVVLPTVHARTGDTLYIPGTPGSRFSLLGGGPVGVT